jgi:hypothetical protein
MDTLHEYKVSYSFEVLLETLDHSLRYGPCQYLYDDEVLNYHKALKYYEILPEITFND